MVSYSTADQVWYRVSDMSGIPSSQTSWKRGPSLAHEGETTESFSEWPSIALPGY